MLVLCALRWVTMSSQGEKVSHKERTTPCEEKVPHKERFVRIGELRDNILVHTLVIKETSYQKFLPRRVGLLTRSWLLLRRTGSSCGEVYQIANLSTYLNNIFSKYIWSVSTANHLLYVYVGVNIFFSTW
jgi:hypothetical protein